MKKILWATAALAMLSMGGTAGAADLPPAYKAPPPPVVYSWTGCYVGAGGGYGMWNQDTYRLTDPGGIRFTLSETSGGRGWFGTVQVGCDYQFASSWVIGAFADYDFASIKGDFSSSGGGNIGEEKMRSAWAAGGRIGWTPFDRLLVFFSAGYTQAYFNRIDLISTFAPNVPAGLYYPAHTYKGWFVGSGYEYAIGWLPGLTWKTEYRFADYRADNVPLLFTATGLSAGEAINSHKYTHMVRSELVWRFGGSAVVAKY